MGEDDIVLPFEPDEKAELDELIFDIVSRPGGCHVEVLRVDSIHPSINS